MSKETPDLLIRGGTVVDGTGSPARRADLRLRDEKITRVNGVPTFLDGKYTSARPGILLAPRSA